MSSNEPSDQEYSAELRPYCALRLQPRPEVRVVRHWTVTASNKLEEDDQNNLGLEITTKDSSEPKNDHRAYGPCH